MRTIASASSGVASLALILSTAFGKGRKRRERRKVIGGHLSAHYQWAPVSWALPLHPCWSLTTGTAAAVIAGARPVCSWRARTCVGVHYDITSFVLSGFVARMNALTNRLSAFSRSFADNSSNSGAKQPL